MILVALGSNVHGPWGTPEETVRRALKSLDHDGMHLRAASRLLMTKPFGKLNQPLFVNAVAWIETHLPPLALLQKLHAIEKAAGRRRKQRWGPRTLDLDILDYHGLARTHAGLTLPHPGIAERIFVLKPLAEIAPGWRHPTLRQSASQMLRRISSHGAGGEI
jgi:2-amino-4-hydroxy-6-hydroxymethyldihydropteridine diphosphokinase